jgi:hypothetical protein
VITQNLDASRGKRSDGSGHWLSVIPETLQINYQPKQLTKIELKNPSYLKFLAKQDSKHSLPL